MSPQGGSQPDGRNSETPARGFMDPPFNNSPEHASTGTAGDESDTASVAASTDDIGPAPPLKYMLPPDETVDDYSDAEIMGVNNLAYVAQQNAYLIQQNEKILQMLSNIHNALDFGSTDASDAGDASNDDNSDSDDDAGNDVALPASWCSMTVKAMARRRSDKGGSVAGGGSN